MSGRGEKTTPPPTSSAQQPPPIGRARGAPMPGGPTPPPGSTPGRGAQPPTAPPGRGTLPPAPGRGAPSPNAPGRGAPLPIAPGRGAPSPGGPPPPAGRAGPPSGPPVGRGAPSRPQVSPAPGVAGPPRPGQTGPSPTGPPPQRQPGAPQPGAVQPGRDTPGYGRADTRGAVGGLPQVGQRPDDQKVHSVTGQVSNLSLLSSVGSQGSAGRGTELRGTNAPGGPPSLQRHDDENRRRFKTKPENITSKVAVFKPGTAMPIELVTNYYKVAVDKSWRLWQYRVDILPDTDSTGTRKHLIGQHRGPDKRLKEFMFDGTMLFTPNKYVAAIGESISVTSKDERTSIVHQITIKLTKELEAEDHFYTQFWNIVLHQCMDGLKLDRLGRNYYDGKAAKTLANHKLEVWPGYVTSIRDHESEMLMCCETSNKIIRKETALDIMTKNKSSVPAMKAALIGSIVITRYNNKTYRIDDIDFDMGLSRSTFDNKGTQTSFFDYFTKRYGVKMTQKDTPLLVSNPRDADFRRAEQRGFKAPTPILLAPELCVMTGLTDQMRANFKLMSDVAVYTRLPPTGRVAELQKFAQRMAETKEVQETCKAWNFKMNRNLEKIKGNLLCPEPIIPGGNKQPFKYKVDNADWGACFRNWTLFGSVPCELWAVIYPAKNKAETGKFMNELLSVAPGLGFNLSTNPGRFEIKDDRSASFIQEIEKILPKKPSMIMCVIPNANGDQYGAIKKKLYVQHAVPSQVMTAKVIQKEKGLKSVATKVAIQMAAKLGGEPWALKIPIKKMMVIGYDSYHDSSQAGSSIGALVASTNETITRFHSTCIRQTTSTKAEELARSLGIGLKNSLEHYRKANNCYPDRVLFYRDGVGEGQVDFVRQHEVSMVQSTFKDLGFAPKFAYIVVSKRINSRFFGVGKTASEPYMNPPSGTCIDDVVTLPERYDFFLVSQSVRQGTVNPTSYNVIHDESSLSPAQLQMVTYKLCHLYFNWPGTVRVPAVCQYAHKLAFLAGQSLHQLPNERLQDRLYYL